MNFKEILRAIISIQKIARRTQRTPVTGTRHIDPMADVPERQTKDREKEKTPKELFDELKSEVAASAAPLLDEIFANIMLVGEGKLDSSRDVEHILLPITTLALLTEQNGRAEDHAHKLAIIFGNADDALTYLYTAVSEALEVEIQKAKKEKREPVIVPAVHDACGFALPDDNTYDFTPWRGFIKDNMSDPEFRKLLARAPDIEAMINGQVKKQDKPHDRKITVVDETPVEKQVRIAEQRKQQAEWVKVKKSREDDLNKAIERVQKLTSVYKIVRGNRMPDGKKVSIEADKVVEYNDIYDNYAPYLLAAELKLVAASSAIRQPFAEIKKVEIIKAYGTKYSADAEAEFKYFLDHGLTKANYAKFVGLKRIDDDARIPPIIIDGASIGKPGYYLRRLNVVDSVDAATGACLGKLTNCCQSLSGEAGQPCAIHGLTSANGGFFVVCKGDAKNPSVNDPVICQSWVWRSETDALVIDSIEAADKSRENTELAELFYYNLTAQMISEHGVKKVCIGANSGISRCISTKNESATTQEQPVDYSGYRDSLNQVLVAAVGAEYLLPLPGWVDHFFQTCKDKAPDAVEYIEMIKYAIFTKRKDLLDEYSKVEPNLQTLAACKSFISLLEQGNYQQAIEECKNKNLYTLSAKNGDTALIMAVKNKNSSFALKLIDEGIALDAASDGGTALMLAIETDQTDIAQKLIAAPGIAFDKHNNDGETALMLAAKKGNISLLNALIGKDVILGATDNNSKTALMLALANGKVECAEKLIDVDAGLNETDGYECTALMYALRRGYKKCALDLIEKNAALDTVNGHKDTALIIASTLGEVSCVNALIAKKVNLNVKDARGDTALMQALLEDKFECAVSLINANCNVIEISESGNTALIIAAMKGHAGCVKALIEKGAALDVKNAKGNTVLMLALEKGKSECAIELIKKNVALDVVNASGDTALMLACQHDRVDCVHELIRRGVALDVENIDGRTALIIALLYDRADCALALIDTGVGLDIEGDDSRGNKATALIIAARNGMTDCVKKLIEKRAALDATDNQGSTALMIALEHGRIDCALALIKGGANLNLANNTKQKATALIIAVMEGRGECVQALIAKGVTIDTKDAEGNTALMLAKKGKHNTCIGILEAELVVRGQMNAQAHMPMVFSPTTDTVQPAQTPSPDNNPDKFKPS